MTTFRDQEAAFMQHLRETKRPLTVNDKARRGGAGCRGLPAPSGLGGRRQH